MLCCSEGHAKHARREQGATQYTCLDSASLLQGKRVSSFVPLGLSRRDDSFWALRLQHSAEVSEVVYWKACEIH